MSLRFRKSIKIMPGMRLNVSRSGISTSIGVRGASVNVKPGRKARVSVGIPGTGISYTDTLSPAQHVAQTPAPRRADSRRVWRALGIAIAVVGGLSCFGSWIFGLSTIGAGAALYLANSASRS